MRILISPLDWGLGHATRCIPLIRCFLQNECEVIIACNAVQQSLLEKEFNGLHFLPLNGYNIRYASSKRWFAAKILQQIPKILFAIQREHQWLKKAVMQHKIDLIISDNRFGFYHKRIPSVFITHQLYVQTPYVWLSRWVQKVNYHFINRFRECWVPDYEGKANLAGILSHPEKLPKVPVSYIGPLSRFRKQEKTNIRYKWLLLLSGPEPQRTLLEQALIEQFSRLQHDVLLIRGLPSASETLKLPVHFTVFNHLPTEKLEEALAQSEYVISRSGYTTLMELMALQKKAILIPTPGQTEQEYLAKHLATQQWCLWCKTNAELPGCLQQVTEFSFRLPRFPTPDLNTFIKQFLKK